MNTPVTPVLIIIDVSLLRSAERTVNVLAVSGLNRAHQGSRLSCVATNNNISASPTTSLLLDIQVLPALVKISSTAGELVEGGGLSLECVVSGGNPRPSVVWLLNQQPYTTLEYVSLAQLIASQLRTPTFSRGRARATLWSAPSSSPQPGNFTGQISPAGLRWQTSPATWRTQPG